MTAAAHDVPAEIWGKIFEQCCTDRGQTGRSLALVSHYINTVSKPYQYQSVALSGPGDIAQFVDLLVHDHDTRRVKYLFISTFKPDPNTTAFVREGSLQASSPYPLYSTSTPSLNSPSETDGGPLRANHVILADIQHILDLVSPTLITLHILMDFYREEMFFSTFFPCLEELSIQGPFHDHYDCNDEFCDTLYPRIPSLRRLYLTEVFTCVKDRTFLALRHYAPALTHLKIQCAEGYIESSRIFLRQLLESSEEDEEDRQNQTQTQILRSGYDTEDRTKNKQLHFPQSLQQILLHPGPAQLARTRCGAMYLIRCHALLELERCASQDPRVKLLEESPWVWPYSRTYGYVQGEKYWLDSISGGSGCWENVCST